MTSASTASMQFAPEWLKPGRKQPTKQPSFSSLADEPTRKGSADDQPHSTAPSYSSLLSGGALPAQAALESGGAPGSGMNDGAHPFRYSKEQMLNVWKDGGGQRAGLGAEVARWAGIVRDDITEPAGLRELSAEEKKIFSGSLNSNTNNGSNRRQSTGIPPTNLIIGGGGAKGAFTGGLGSPRTERFSGTGTSPSTGSVLTRRRRDDTGETPAPVGVYRPRQLSVSGSTPSGGPLSPGNALPSPRPRAGGGVDGVMGDSWMRRRTSDRPGISTVDSHMTETPLETHEEIGDGRGVLDGDLAPGANIHSERQAHLADSPPPIQSDAHGGAQNDLNPGIPHGDLHPSIGVGLPSSFQNGGGHSAYSSNQPVPPQPSIPNESVEWRYKDQEGQLQGPFPSSTMQSWYQQSYFPDTLLIQRAVPPYDPIDPNVFETLAEYKKKLPPAAEALLFLKGMELAPPRPPNLPMPSATSAFIDEHRDHSIFPPSRSASGMSSGPPRSDGGFNNNNSIQQNNGPYQSYPASLLNGGSGISRSLASGRQGSVDSFSQYPIAPSPLHSSPALSAGVPQSYSAPSAAFNGVPQAPASISTDRERQEREDLFKMMREKELASGGLAPGPARTNSVGSGISGLGGLNGSYGVAPGAGVINQQLQAVSRSPMFSQAAPTPIGYQQGVPTAQQSAYHNAFPRPTAFQQGSLPPSPYQQQQHSSNAWLAAPGQLARQVAPPSSAIERPIDQQSQWSGAQDNEWRQHQFQIQQARQHQQQQQQQQQFNEQLYRQGPSQQTLVETFPNISARYSTATAVQSVQSQSAGNFGLPRGFVDPPEQELQSPLEQQQQQEAQLPPLATDEQVKHIAALLDDAQLDSLPAGVSEPSSAAVEEPEPVAPTPAVTEAPAKTRRQSAVRASKPVVEAQAPVPSPSTVPSKGEPSVPVVSTPEVAAPAASTKPARPSVTTTTSSSTAPSPATATSPPAATPAVATPATTTPSKPAWSAPAPASSSTGASAGASLREIQEAEAKRSEARKEKEKAARAAALAANPPASSITLVPASTSTEDVPKTTTWGLSLAGQGTRAAVTSPSSSSPAPAAANASAWSTPTAAKGGAAKKSMKEILEEEERRKKAAAAAQAQALAAAAAQGGSAEATLSSGKKAYVDTAKAGEAKAPSAAAATNSVWTTVGSKGSSNPAPSPVRPTAPATVKSSAAVVPAAKPAVVIPAKKAAVVVAASDAHPPPPSIELIKWMKEALRGLTGVNMDEFITMLLDFAVEPDAETMEIISDSVYTYSSTLDGRRFASEFVARRKADVAKARGGSSAGGGANGNGGWSSVGASGGANGGGVAAAGSGWGKGVSIADVVKAQPKAAEKEWGYKVVKKKGKKT